MSQLQAVNTAVQQPELALSIAPSSVADATPWVLLHGWGSDSSTMAPLVAELQQQAEVVSVDLPGFGASEPWPQITLDNLLQALDRQLPPRFQLLGWSLGGMLAVAFAHRYPQRVERLVTLAANASFASRSDWPSAMDKRVYQQFCHFFDNEPATCLKQFCGLQAQGDGEQRAILKSLRNQLPQATNANWNRLLALLGEMDNRTALAEMTVPTLHLFGDGDNLVPAAAAAAIQQMNPQHRVVVLSGKGHCLHMPDSSPVLTGINKFIQQQCDKLDKQLVAQSFSRAAASYDSAAQFQRDTADRLMARLPVDWEAEVILDVGCGTGYLCEQIRQRFVSSYLTAVDLAPGMLEYAQQKRLADNRPLADRWVCGDAEALPLTDGQFDLLLSNLAYQWCEHPEAWSRELKRVLKPQTGRALITSFAPNTLFELRDAWQQVDDYTHVNRFIAPEQIRQAIKQAGLECELEIEPQVLRYRELSELMRELKQIGAHNINSGKNSGLTGRERLRKLTAAYEQYRDSDGWLTATYQVMYLTIFHP